MVQKIDTSMLKSVAAQTKESADSGDSEKVVQLDTSGQIPSAYLPDTGVSLVDGRHLALEVADLKGAALQFGEGEADPYDSDTPATKTNATYDATNDYFHNPAGTSDIAQGTGTAFGDMTEVGNLAAAFDGDEDQDSSACSYKTGGADGYIGKDWGDGVTKTVSQYVVISSDSNGFKSSGSGSVTLTLYGSNSSPSNSTDGTSLHTDTFTSTNTKITKTYTSGITTTTAYRYHWVTLASANNHLIAEIKFTESTTSGDITLINNALTASSAPSKGLISVQAQFVDSSTLNTDMTAEISRDGGTTWTSVTLTAGATNANFTMYSGEATISSQPSGTSMKYRVKTLNNKNIRISGVVLRWS